MHVFIWQRTLYLGHVHTKNRYSLDLKYMRSAAISFYASLVQVCKSITFYEFNYYMLYLRGILKRLLQGSVIQQILVVESAADQTIYIGRPPYSRYMK